MRHLLTRYPSSEDSDFHVHQKTLTSLRFIYLKISELDVPDVLSHVVACFFSYLSQHHLSQELEQLQLEKEPRIYPELHFLPLRALVCSPRFIQTYSNILKLSIPKSTYFGSRQEKLEKAASLALKRSEAATLWMTNPCTICNRLQ